jgi:hypothetical protein
MFPVRHHCVHSAAPANIDAAPAHVSSCGPSKFRCASQQDALIRLMLDGDVPSCIGYRYMEPDIRAVSKMIREQRIVSTVMPEWSIEGPADN